MKKQQVNPLITMVDELKKEGVTKKHTFQQIARANNLTVWQVKNDYYRAKEESKGLVTLIVNGKNLGSVKIINNTISLKIG